MSLTEDRDQEFANDPPAMPQRTSDLPYGTPQSLLMLVATLAAVVAAVVSVVALIVAVRIDDTGGGGAVAPVAPGAPGAESVDMLAGDFFFDPDNAVVAQDFTLSLTNEGAVEHNLTILASGTQIASESEFEESMVIERLPLLAAGEAESDSFSLEPGTYQFICTVSGHFDNGMAGQLVVS